MAALAAIFYFQNYSVEMRDKYVKYEIRI